MGRYNTIVIVHPGAIGDAVMGTPVARTLRANYPDAKIIYLTHSSLFPLLELSGVIDLFIPWNRHTPLLDLVAELRQHKPDLLVDLVASLRTRAVCFLSPGKALTFKKERDRKNWSHLVDNYLATIEPLNLPHPQPLFPSLKPPAELVRELQDDEELGTANPLIALVPGVGKHRPNRAWPPERWAQLGNELVKKYGGKLVLVGGADDEDTRKAVAEALEQRCSNLAGKMSLVQTASLLSLAQLVVSADTGPAHIATAVGKQVVCLMGPTVPTRTGPYQMENIGINVGSDCQCQQAKRCLRNDGTGAGECMKTIEVAEVLRQVEPLMTARAAAADQS